MIKLLSTCLLLILFLVLISDQTLVLAADGTNESFTVSTVLSIVLGVGFVIGAFYFQKSFDAKFRQKLKDQYQFKKESAQAPKDIISNE